MQGASTQPEQRPGDADDQPAIDGSQDSSTTGEANDRTTDEAEAAQLTMSLFDVAATPVAGWISRRRHSLLREALEMCVGAEPVAAGLAADRIGGDEIVALGAANAGMADANGDGDDVAYLLHDADFCRLIHHASRNTLFAQLIGIVSSVLHSRFSASTPPINDRPRRRSSRTALCSMPSPVGTRPQRSVPTVRSLPPPSANPSTNGVPRPQRVDARSSCRARERSRGR